MISVLITEQKNFMSRLLASELLDSYFVESARIDTYNTFSIDGRIHKEFYKDLSSSQEPPEDEFSRWARIRPICLDLIKGKQTPLSFKFVLMADEDTKMSVLKGAGIEGTGDQVSLGLNISFNQGQVTVTTGVAMKVFSLDKTAEKAWDKYIPSFLESNDIKISDL